MKLYDKKLRTMADLKQELALKKAEADNYFSNILSPSQTDVNTAQPGGNTADSSNAWVNDLVVTGMDFITSKGLGDKLGAFALPALRLAGRRVENKLLTSAFKEFGLGYLKWKAIQIGCRFAYRTLKSKLEKK